MHYWARCFTVWLSNLSLRQEKGCKITIYDVYHKLDLPVKILDMVVWWKLLIWKGKKNWTFILESADPQTQHCTMSILKDSLCVQFWPTSSHRKHYNPSVCCLRQHYFRTFGTEKLCWLLFNHVWNFFVLYFEFYRMPCTFNFLFIAIMKTVPGYISGKVPRLCCVEVICWGCGLHLFFLQLRSMWKPEVSDGILL